MATSDPRINAAGSETTAASSAASIANGASRYVVPSSRCDISQSACAVVRHIESPSPARIIRTGAAASTPRSKNAPTGVAARTDRLNPSSAIDADTDVYPFIDGAVANTPCGTPSCSAAILHRSLIAPDPTATTASTPASVLASCATVAVSGSTGSGSVAWVT